MKRYDIGMIEEQDGLYVLYREPMTREEAEKLVHSWYNAQCATDAYETQSDALTASKLYKQIIAALTGKEE